ncbi:globin [Glutamicibacter nicotianae]|uniref:globin n=1 Tax=Glutamicibacter nicotianae TaxID=37929 RepID=UPI0023BA4F66|nr:globin [Glutamicibacter nicotianae]MBM7768680.1 hemoglobin [Glutamicibacter nicotianae]
MTENQPTASDRKKDPFSNPLVLGRSSQEFLDAAEAPIDVADFPGTFYAEIGGREVFAQLTKNFYSSVAEDADFRRMYPEKELHAAQVRLQLFLEQYWGGPTTFSEHRGHPRLRMRHANYPVNSHYRDVWLGHMNKAIDQLELPMLQADTLRDYFERAAHSLLNTPDGHQSLL